jgi:hypothetical protein
MSIQLQRSLFCHACQGTLYIVDNLLPISLPRSHFCNPITSALLTTTKKKTRSNPSPAAVAGTSAVNAIKKTGKIARQYLLKMLFISSTL